MAKPGRIYFIDNIRWFIISLVVMMHSAVTYSNMGRWYYYEPVKLDLAYTMFFGIILTFTHAYSMGLLFLIAGYFVPGSLDRKGLGGFLRDRAIRLGIPTLIYMLFIYPAQFEFPGRKRTDVVCPCPSYLFGPICCQAADFSGQ